MQILVGLCMKSMGEMEFCLRQSLGQLGWWILFRVGKEGGLLSRLQ